MTRHQLSQVQDELSRCDNVCAAFLLGSAVRNALRPDSDIDIAVLPAPGTRIGIEEKIELMANISRITGRDTDMGILDSTNLVYAKEAYLGGDCIFTRNQFYQELFGANVLGMYLTLRKEREEIENAYRNR